MGIRVGLEMLAVLLILTPLVSKGMVMPKCEVVDQLMSAVLADVPGHDKLVAQSEFKTIFYPYSCLFHDTMRIKQRLLL